MNVFFFIKLSYCYVNVLMYCKDNFPKHYDVFTVVYKSVCFLIPVQENLYIYVDRKLWISIEKDT